MVKVSCKEDLRQSKMHWGSQEKKAFYIRCPNTLGTGLINMELGPQMKSPWGLHRRRIAMNHNEIS